MAKKPLKKLRWAVMGEGLQGRRLMRAIKNSAHAELAASASERRRGSFAAALASKQVDAVAIATPNNEHASQVIRAARAGKNILCEKPLALTLHDTRRMERAIRTNRVRCLVDYHLRMHREVGRARKILSQKKLGRLTYIEMHWSVGGLAGKAPKLPLHMRWRENPVRSGGGALMARGVHLFDLLRFLTGEEVVEVRGWSDATARTVDKTAVAICILESGTPAILTTSRGIPNANNRVMVYGTKGRLELHGLFTDDPQKMYERVFAMYAEARRGERTLLATLDDGAAAVAIAEAFTKSARDGTSVRVR